MCWTQLFRHLECGHADRDTTLCDNQRLNDSRPNRACFLTIVADDIDNGICSYCAENGTVIDTDENNNSSGHISSSPPPPPRVFQPPPMAYPSSSPLPGTESPKRKHGESERGDGTETQAETKDNQHICPTGAVKPETKEQEEDLVDGKSDVAELPVDVALQINKDGKEHGKEAGSHMPLTQLPYTCIPASKGGIHVGAKITDMGRFPGPTLLRGYPCDKFASLPSLHGYPRIFSNACRPLAAYNAHYEPITFRNIDYKTDKHSGLNSTSSKDKVWLQAAGSWTQRLLALDTPLLSPKTRRLSLPTLKPGGLGNPATKKDQQKIVKHNHGPLMAELQAIDDIARFFGDLKSGKIKSPTDLDELQGYATIVEKVRCKHGSKRRLGQKGDDVDKQLWWFHKQGEHIAPYDRNCPNLGYK